MSHLDNCIFCKIVAGQIPSNKVYEDDEMFVFHDIHPWAPVHLLMIPKAHIPSMAQVGAEHAALLGRMMVLAPQLAQRPGHSGTALIDDNLEAFALRALSAREVEVLDMLAAGHANKVIARRLDISPNTVKTHVAKLFEKLDVASRTQAIGKARELDILP